MSAKGKFVWHDLMSFDVEKSKRFYGELFNWRIWKGEHGGDYQHISAGDRDIGGMVALDPNHGAPPHWIGYVNTDSVDATIQRATEAGGRVIVPATDVPHVGRFAIVGDARGAVFSPFTGIDEKHDVQEESQPGPGEFCWDELLTDDPDAELRFYAHVFGWTHEKMDMQGFGTYYLFKRGQVNAGGMMKSPPDAPHPPFWLTYVAVADADGIVARATKLGAVVYAPPRDIPGVGRFAVLADNGQATFAILQPSR